jgi:hypothetical protein
MSYYVFPTTQPRLHTLTCLAEVDSWAAFREACEGGGTPPHWTQLAHWTQLGDFPELWKAPPDAAGGLILWCADGALWRVEPPRSDPEQIAAKALADLQDAAGAAWADWDGTYVPRAAYFSSGGSAPVALTGAGAFGRERVSHTRSPTCSLPGGFSPVQFQEVNDLTSCHTVEVVAINDVLVHLPEWG